MHVQLNRIVEILFHFQRISLGMQGTFGVIIKYYYLITNNELTIHFINVTHLVQVITFNIWITCADIFEI